MPYDPNGIVTLQAAEGYALVVELSDEERVENIVVGDSGAWQVTPNKRGNRVIIKPLASATVTNMVLTTDLRAYVFILQPGSNTSSTPFLVRFSYPQSSVAVAQRIVAEYRLRGSKTLFPILMTDDGSRTTIRWNPDAPLPAITAVDKQDREAIVNGRMIDGDYVIERVADRYVFRRDKAQAVATRQSSKASGK